MTIEFGTDGLRGPFENLDLQGIRNIANLLNVKYGSPVIIGTDTRGSSENLKDAIISGLIGPHIDLGVLPTPALSHYVAKMGHLSPAIMITASHNPHTDNGIKLFSPDGRKLHEGEEELIRAYNQSKDYSLEGKLKNNKIDNSYYARQIYFDRVTRGFDHFEFNKPIIIDCANGCASDYAKALFQDKLSLDTTLIHNTPNGNNINLNCGSLHSKQLGDLVRQESAYLGIAFDGDADRVIFTDENGFEINGDQIMAYLAISMSKSEELKYNTLVVTDYSNLALDERLKQEGINVVRVGNGDKNVFAKMNQDNLSFGGEQSGHIIFGTEIGSGDGMYTAMQLLKRLNPFVPVSTQLRIFDPNPQHLLNIGVKIKTPFEEIPGLIDLRTKLENQLGDNSRIHMRYSGTESKCRIMVEGGCNGKVITAANKLSRHLQNYVA